MDLPGEAAVGTTVATKPRRHHSFFYQYTVTSLLRLSEPMFIHSWILYLVWFPHTVEDMSPNLQDPGYQDTQSLHYNLLKGKQMQEKTCSG